MTININHIKTYLGCDDKFLGELIDKFLSEMMPAIAKISTATASGEWPVVRGTSHKLLSSTRIFGLDELSELLETMEKHAEKLSDLDKMPALTDTLRQYSQQVMDALREEQKKLWTH